MARVPRNVITVSPPNLDRSGFLSLEKGLAEPDHSTGRDWLIDRLSQGLQVRMLRPPLRGFIEFVPGRATWRPITGAGQSVVIEALRVDGQAGRVVGIGALLRVAEDWARYFGFSTLLIMVRDGDDPEMRAELRRQNYVTLDRTMGSVQLWGRVLQGPISLPLLPQDWLGRASRLGPGLVVQSLGDGDALWQRAEELLSRGREAGLATRHDHLSKPEQARVRLASPDAMSCVVLDGDLVGYKGWSVTQIWQEICRRKGI
ncbi:hypothetical protein [Nioella aestuarii]|uniref:hypothetical protein n=1 Tax=Nioella aestuarii TaxID=1662864 RepID=UPI003D80002C